MIILTAGIDLAKGSIAVLGTIVAGRLVNDGHNAALCLLLAILLCTGVGLVAGTLVSRLMFEINAKDSPKSEGTVEKPALNSILQRSYYKRLTPGASNRDRTDDLLITNQLMPSTERLSPYGKTRNGSNAGNRKQI